MDSIPPVFIPARQIELKESEEFILKFGKATDTTFRRTINLII